MIATRRAELRATAAAVDVVLQSDLHGREAREMRVSLGTAADNPRAVGELDGVSLRAPGLNTFPLGLHSCTIGVYLFGPVAIE